MRTHIHQAGESARARHSQIEKNEIDFAAALEQLDKLVECAGLGDIHARQQADHRLAQRATKQWMVVGNDQTVLQAVVQTSPLLAAVAWHDCSNSTIAGTSRRARTVRWNLGTSARFAAAQPRAKTK